MSRFTVARRLTAVLALLAVICLATPASAAAGSHRHTSPATSQVSLSLLDQFLAWLGLGPSSPAGSHSASSLDKSTLVIPPPGAGRTVDSTDASQGFDPNGHQ
jgi:hypothetical protein